VRRRRLVLPPWRRRQGGLAGAGRRRLLLPPWAGRRQAGSAVRRLGRQLLLPWRRRQIGVRGGGCGGWRRRRGRAGGKLVSGGGRRGRVLICRCGGSGK